MKKPLIGIISALILLNTACSPKQEDAPNSSTQSSIASHEVTVASSLEAAAPASTEAAVTPAETPSLPNSGLLNSYWKLILLNDKEITVSDSQKEPNIVLNSENRVTGSDGCNSLTGSYLLDGEKLTFGEMAATRMACAEGGDQAQAFNEALTKVTSYTVHSDQLELRDATGLVVARFKVGAQP